MPQLPGHKRGRPESEEGLGKASQRIKILANLPLRKLRKLNSNGDLLDLKERILELEEEEDS